MDITGMDKAQILASLYNRSFVQGMGVLQAKPGAMSIEEAQELLDSGETYFDYVHGRVMKIDLSGDELETRLYNRDVGKGAAEEILNSMADGKED